MSHDDAQARAVIFDLDDTLYPLDRYVLSGFGAVSAYLASSWGISRPAVLALLVRAFKGGARGRELQCCVAAFGLPVTLVPTLVQVMRAHRPRLHLPRASARTLAALRRRWRVGIVTNGLPDLQARKVEALGLAPLVDTVVYAHDVGARVGKPDPAPFLEAAARLRVPLSRAVFVGDDPLADVYGADRVGMRTIQITRRGRCGATVPVAADATVGELSEVPDVAERLMEGDGGIHGV